MQVTEIVKDVAKTNFSVDMLKRYLEEKGWDILGTGAEAVVAVHPAQSLPYVLKIFKRPSMYKLFVDLVKDMPNNPHWPRFSRYVKPVPGTDWLYVRMEKLQRISKSHIRVKFPLEMMHLHKQLGANNFSNYFIPIPDEKDQRTIENKNPSWENDVDPSWKQAVKLLITEAKEFPDIRIDLHQENFMVRGDTLVIIDPYY